MATWNTLVFYSYRDMQDFLNGSLLSPGVIPSAGAFVDGLTLIINPGAGDQTVSFTPAKNRAWTIHEIVAKIAAAHATLAAVPSAFFVGRDNPTAGDPGRARLRLSGTGSGIVIRGNGTANDVFGWPEGVSPADDTVGTAIVNTAVHSIHHHVGEQDTWHVLTYA
jgi:hypothetical protein